MEGREESEKGPSLKGGRRQREEEMRGNEREEEECKRRRHRLHYARKGDKLVGHGS